MIAKAGETRGLRTALLICLFFKFHINICRKSWLESEDSDCWVHGVGLLCFLSTNLMRNRCDELQQNREQVAQVYFEIWTIEVCMWVKNDSSVDFEISVFLCTFICLLLPPCNLWLIFKHFPTKILHFLHPVLSKPRGIGVKNDSSVACDFFFFCIAYLSMSSITSM